MHSVLHSPPALVVVARMAQSQPDGKLKDVDQDFPLFVVSFFHPSSLGTQHFIGF